MLSPSCSSPVRCSSSSSTILADSSTLCQKRLLDSTAPNRRPSAGPPTPTWTDSITTTATAAAPLARSSSRRRRHSCSQWRSNTYSNTDQCRGSIEATGDDCQAEAGGIAATTPTTILRLRDAMRELARPQMQLCLGSPPSACNSTLSTLSVATVGVVGQKRRQRRPSGGKHSPTSPPHSALQQQPTLLTLAATGGGATTTRSASVCYLPSAQQISRRCSTTTRSGRLERSNSLVAGRGNATLAFLPELNPQQVANLRRTWKHINTKGLYDIIRRSFRKVESANPSVALAFRHNGISSPPPPTADGTKQLGAAAAAAAAASETNNAAGDNGNLPQTKYCGVMEHSKYFMVLLNRIIDGDPQEDLERELKQIGARHVMVYKRFGVGVTAIERTGEALAESLFKLDGIRQSKETTKVWRVLIAKIVDHIESGFTDELRSQRRQTSSALLSSAAGALAAPLFDNKFFKRNSVPSPHNHKSSVRSASNEERDDDHGGSPTATPASKAAPPSAAPYHHQQQQQQQQSTSSSGSCFLRTELAGVVRRLSNM